MHIIRRKVAVLRRRTDWSSWGPRVGNLNPGWASYGPCLIGHRALESGRIWSQSASGGWWQDPSTKIHSSNATSFRNAFASFFFFLSGLLILDILLWESLFELPNVLAIEAKFEYQMKDKAFGLRKGSSRSSHGFAPYFDVGSFDPCCWLNLDDLQDWSENKFGLALCLLRNRTSQAENGSSIQPLSCVQHLHCSLFSSSSSSSSFYLLFTFPSSPPQLLHTRL